jgi:hypothetical protein
MGQLLTKAAAGARQWLLRHWSTVWPPLVVLLVVGLGAASIDVVPISWFTATTPAPPTA